MEITYHHPRLLSFLHCQEEMEDFKKLDKDGNHLLDAEERTRQALSFGE